MSHRPKEIMDCIETFIEEQKAETRPNKMLTYKTTIRDLFYYLEISNGATAKEICERTNQRFDYFKQLMSECRARVELNSKLMNKKAI